MLEWGVKNWNLEQVERLELIVDGWKLRFCCQNLMPLSFQIYKGTSWLVINGHEGPNNIFKLFFPSISTTFQSPKSFPLHSFKFHSSLFAFQFVDFVFVFSFASKTSQVSCILKFWKSLATHKWVWMHTMCYENL